MLFMAKFKKFVQENRVSVYLQILQIIVFLLVKGLYRSWTRMKLLVDVSEIFMCGQVQKNLPLYVFVAFRFQIRKKKKKTTIK